MGTKRHLAKMKTALSSKKRKLDEAETESPEPELISKDKKIEALRAALAERDAKIADLQKQLDWALNTNSFHERIAENDHCIANLQGEIAEMKALITLVACNDNNSNKDEAGKRDAVFEQLKGLQKEVEVCKKGLTDQKEEMDTMRGQVEKLKKEQLDKLLEKTIKDFME